MELFDRRPAILTGGARIDPNGNPTAARAVDIALARSVAAMAETTTAGDRRARRGKSAGASVRLAGPIDTLDLELPRDPENPLASTALLEWH